MAFAKQIEAARKKRVELIESMETLINAAEADERPMSEEEQKTFDAIKLEVSDVDARLKQLLDMEALSATKAVSVTGEDGDDNAGAARGPLIMRDTKRQKVKGGFFARAAHLLYQASGNRHVAADIAERGGDKEMGAVLRAAVSDADSATSGWASQLVQQETQDFIDLLRPMSIYGRIPAGTTVVFDSTNSIKIPRTTSGTPGGFVAEGAAIPVKAGAFDTLTLTPSKMGVITVATREVLARSTPALETLLRDMMLRDTAITLDRKFLSTSAAAAGAPSGLFHTDNAPAAVTASALANPADDAIADISALLTAMYTANVPLSNVVWVMHPTKKQALMNLRSATGAFYFRDELIGNTLQGYPVLDSSVFDIGVNSGGASNLDGLALIDASLLVKGNGLAPTIALSTDAAIEMDDAPSQTMASSRSLFQTDSSALRLTWETTWRMKNTVGVQYIVNVAW